MSEQQRRDALVGFVPAPPPGSSEAFKRGWYEGAADLGLRVDAHPANPAPERDPITEAHAEARYNAQNAWRGDAWLDAHPYQPLTHADGRDPIADARAKNRYDSANAWKGEAWLAANPWKPGAT
jgi:hypothetical protein